MYEIWFCLDDTNELRSSRQPDVDSSDNLDELLRHHQNKQESIAEELMAITRGLREHSELAGKIIKKDIEVYNIWQNVLILFNFLNYFILDFRKIIKRYGY